MHEYMQAICGVDEVLGRLKDRSRVRDVTDSPAHVATAPYSEQARKVVRERCRSREHGDSR